MCAAKYHDMGRVAPAAAVHARRLLLSTVKHQAVDELYPVPCLQSVSSSSLRSQPRNRQRWDPACSRVQT